MTKLYHSWAYKQMSLYQSVEVYTILYYLLPYSHYLENRIRLDVHSLMTDEYVEYLHKKILFSSYAY